MARIAFALPIDLDDVLAESARNHGHEIAARCDNADELTSLLEVTSCEFAVVASDDRYLSQRLLAEADRVGVRVVAVNISDAGRRNAKRIGLHEVVDAAAEWVSIEGMLLSRPLRATAAPQTSEGGRIIVVWGPTGAPGRTSLAVGVAAELATAGHSVALADVDTYSGSVAPTLGLLDEAPGFAAACRLAGADALTTGELERIAQRYDSAHGSFWVLTGIGRPSRWPELSAPRVQGALEKCRNWVEYTVVDAGFSLENDDELSSDVAAPRRNAATLEALRSADVVLAVGTADPVGLSRLLRAHADLLESILTDRVIFVMNRLRASAIGSSPERQVTQSLERFGGIVAPVLIPYDQVAFDMAMLRGATLLDVAPKSQARAAISALVRERILHAGTPARQRRRMGRARFRREPDGAASI